MRIRIFQSGKGDCVLVSSSNNDTRILVDGGVPSTYGDHLSRALSYLERRDIELDVVCVSHIDRDHIGGVLALLDTEVAWRIYEYRGEHGITPNRRPALKRPCGIQEIWHNAFFEDAGLNTPEVVNELAELGSTLAAHPDRAVVDLSDRLVDYGLSVGDAVEVSRRIGANQLGIPLNEEFGGDFMTREATPRVFDVGSISAYILGPTRDALVGLIGSWNEWLEDKASYLRRLIRGHVRDAGELPDNAVANIVDVLTMRAGDLAADRQHVTPPNLASLMFMFEEGNSRAIFTGDGAWEDVIAGLEAHGLMDQHGNIHVNLLKIPHHGAHNSYNDKFARRVTADHYLFCGNGKYHNPEPDVVAGYIRARRGTIAERTTNEIANRRQFKFWFNCSEDAAEPSYRRFWRDMRRDVGRAARRDLRPRMRYRFLSGDSMTKTL